MPRRPYRSHIDDPAEVGRRLREAREEGGVSQRELAFPGCSAAYISRIETGDRVPALQLLDELGKRLGVSGQYLAKGAEPGAEWQAGWDAGYVAGAREMARRLGEQARGALEELETEPG